MTQRDERPEHMTDDLQLAELLSAARPIEPSVALRRAVAEIPLRYPHAERAPGASGWLPSAGWLSLAACSLLVGAWLGTQTQAVFPELAFAPAEVSVQDEAWDDLALLAFADALDEELVP